MTKEEPWWHSWGRVALISFMLNWMMHGNGVTLWWTFVIGCILNVINIVDKNDREHES